MASPPFLPFRHSGMHALQLLISSAVTHEPCCAASAVRLLCAGAALICLRQESRSAQPVVAMLKRACMSSATGAVFGDIPVKLRLPRPTSPTTNTVWTYGGQNHGIPRKAILTINPQVLGHQFGTLHTTLSGMGIHTRFPGPHLVCTRLSIEIRSKDFHRYRVFNVSTSSPRMPQYGRHYASHCQSFPPQRRCSSA